jgi:NADPH2:quinone reductase
MECGIGNRGEITINPRDLMTRTASVCAFTLWVIDAGRGSGDSRRCHRWLENSTRRPVVGKQLPPAEAARAHKEILEAGAFGKIVLIP